ncbi:D-alanyl-D-alanine carboxypeptidase family protein [Tenuibacillus multivorans]|uniref:serine-type D-Ala-D-Ala carboxypeptidase n=1 Tax=Tenuibacillus multivorans TaxID=237069 RepID=A0A1H0CZW7_9BACI|nr:D-alanyl-D-alanine carboxypeptidase family protein [Tenuibacillus multivorans]GEL76100.1 D-alanyl-D-alanine carboxypeptidase DacF [Tenuibacillus multivorans]SDN63409.1 D-alanyl-D-alanine carboxypeptidase (penicillin-binding protein 5/6) [Tenuibacillus multivorans]
MKYKFLISVLVFTLLLPSPALLAEQQEGGEPSDLTESAKSALLMEFDTGEIMYNEESSKRLPPASMTKIMTMLLVMEALDEGTITLDEKVRVSEHAASMGGTQIYLEPFEEMTVKDLLKAVAVASANDASVALAERIAATEEVFVEMMNEKAKSLGLKDTNFVNTTGLPAENHYSSAYDMAVMARELLKHEEITEYTKIYEDYLRKGTDDEFWLVNTNRLVKFYQGVDGLKTGYTSKAKYSLTATAKRDDMRMIAVVMGADTAKDRNKDITNMLDYAFGHYDVKRLFSKDDKVHEWEPLKSNSKIYASPKSNVSLLVKKGDSLEDYQTKIETKSNTWPVEKGDEVGKIKVVKDDEVVAEYPLIVMNDVKDANIWTLWKRSLKSIHRGK